MQSCRFIHRLARTSCSLVLYKAHPRQLSWPLHGLMVLTRRPRVSVETTKGDVKAIVTLEQEVTTEPAIDPPRKKRRVIKSVAAGVHPLGAGAAGVDQIAAAPKKKKAKPKLLETLHTEADLPALRRKANRIYETLMEMYPNPPCPLDHSNAFQLLCSVILSAQSTDKKVNEIVPPLYAIAPDAKAMAALDVSVIEEHIRQIGLAPTKAKNISSMSKALVERHGGEVPDNFEELEQLAGVGHKTASVVLSVVFNKPTFPVDTHIYRLALRWGLTAGKSVEQAEADLKVCWPEAVWNPLHLRLIYFGREHCPAQRHDPAGCSICQWAAVAPYSM